MLVTSVLWGTTGTAATFAPDAGPLAIGAAALGIGGLLQALVAIPALRASRDVLRANAATVLIGALGVAVYPLAFYASMAAAGVAIGSVVSLASAPLASGLLERFLDRRRLGRRWTIAAALGIVGSGLLCIAKLRDPAEAAAGTTLLGIGLGLVAGITYAGYSWCVRRLLAAGAGRAAAMGAVFGAGGALLVPVLCITAAPLVGSRDFLLVAGYMALVPMFCGYLLFGFGLTRVPASTATTITLTEPAVATVLAVAVVGERLAPVAWIGLAVIGLALVVLVVPLPGSRAATSADEAVDRRIADGPGAGSSPPTSSPPTHSTLTIPTGPAPPSGRAPVTPPERTRGRERRARSSERRAADG
ncbi:EamA family transporter [Pseudoclavibacter chungangensis]|uniref:EamA family transporter n=1 Tax=Pseudoclavibacter chungangensis TaxID=587635 RepID=A0A7J5BNN6_9MICO|nr:EamA family transporter [Pseudoclavibacter chungangensis]